MDSMQVYLLYTSGMKPAKIARRLSVELEYVLKELRKLGYAV
jgi:hypothetical protein